MIQWLINLCLRFKQYFPWNWVKITYPNMLCGWSKLKFIGITKEGIEDIACPNAIPFIVTTLHFHMHQPMDFNCTSNRFILVIMDPELKLIFAPLLRLGAPYHEFNRLLDRENLDHVKSNAIIKSMPDSSYVDNYRLQNTKIELSFRDIRILKHAVQHFLKGITCQQKSQF